MRPPWWVRITYRMQLGRMPARYRGWVADDIAGHGYGLWRLWTMVPLLGVAMSDAAARRDRVAVWVAWMALYLAILLLMPDTRNRRQSAQMYLVPQPGDEPTPWDQKPGWICRDRYPAAPVLRHLQWLLVAVVAVAGVAFAAGTSVWSDSWANRWPGAYPGLTVLLGLGGLAAARLAVRWHSRVPSRPSQPARRSVSLERRAGAAWWCWAGWLLVPMALGTDLRHLAALVLLVVGLLALPPVAAGAWLAARGPGDLAAIDVWRLLTGRGPLPADTLVAGVVPASFTPTAPARGPAASPSTPSLA
jgi:hypothetical protein